MYKHICPQCSTPYEDNDIDVYFCPACVEQRKAIAKEVDAKLAHTVNRPVVSDLQAYEMAAKTYTAPNGRKISFMKMT